MRKLLFTCTMMVASLTASAQFTVYRSVDTPRQSYAPSPGYGVPFTYFSPVPNRSYQKPYGGNPSQRIQQPEEPKMQQVTLRGYYKNGKNWYSTPIRVGVIGEEIRLLSAKTEHGWMNCGSKVSEVSGYDEEIIKDNFNYKVYTTLFGTVYF